MTDKQIMIDGTQCRYASFDGGNTQRLLCAIDDCFCDCYRENECYYKQLKAKEQECERLKKETERWKSNFNGKVSAIEELLQQLNQLKAELDLFKQSHKTEQDRRRDYENALTEIKEIATENSLAQVGYNPDWDLILQKISECEGNDE